MLSLKSFKSSKAAQKYYSQGDYYGSEGTGTWFGKGAQELNLIGIFDAKTDLNFSKILNGIMPNGQILGKETSEGFKHRSGLDLTFSCPKSFSIEMLIYADKDEKSKMENALINSINKTLTIVEENGYVVARKGKNGVDKEKINKLIYASFMHTTNRNLEPQVHVHNLLANVVRCMDQKFRTIGNEKLYEYKKYFGQIFRNELALEIKNLGYDIEIKRLSDGSSSFELSKIHPKLIEAFSTRTREIDALCKQYGVTTKEGRDKIVINSRKAKQLIKEEDVIKAWKETEAKISNKIQSLTEFKEKKDSHLHQPIIANDHFEDQEYSAKELSELSIMDVSNNKSIFKKEELLNSVLKFSIGKYSFNDVSYEVEKAELSGDIIGKDNEYTTRVLLYKERQILKYAKGGLGKAKEIIKDKHFKSRYDAFIKRESSKNPNFKINLQQKKALKFILTSKDKTIALEGLPGVGKSTILNAARDISGKKIINLIGLGKNFEGLAPTASAAKTLQNSSGVVSSTLHSFMPEFQYLIDNKDAKASIFDKLIFKNTTIFVDEASLISTNQMYNLLLLQHKLNFSIVFCGDTKQLNSPEAGDPYRQMLSVIPFEKLNHIVRQEREDHREAIIATSQSDIRKAFDIHSENMKQGGKWDELILNSANIYMSKRLKEREETLLISPSKKMRDGINELVRKLLESEGSLKGEVHLFNALRQKDMTNADYRFAPSFSKGDIIRFNKSYKNGIEKNDYLKVIEKNAITNTLTLEKDNKKIEYHLKKGVEHEKKFQVFNYIELKLQEGLKIKFTKNDRNYGLINSETAVIQKMDKHSITLLNEDNTVKIIPKKGLLHIDYGYCMTIHSAQGKTYKDTIAAMNINNHLNNQKLLLVALSRHKKGCTILYEDKQKIMQNILSNKGEQISATEFVSTIKHLNNNDKHLQKNSHLSTIKYNNEFQI